MPTNEPVFLARRPDEARERCEQFARKYRGKDMDLYKLAVLGEAWIAELTGDFDQARSILENLGNERVSVLGHLASLYAGLGVPVEAAGYEQRFLRLFRLRMHRPTFADAVHVAARRYVPLSKLARVRFAEMDGQSTP